MAWVQVCGRHVSGAPAVWGSAPAITVDVAVNGYRDDVTGDALALLWFTVYPVTGSSSFGYNITAAGWVKEYPTYYLEKVIKNNSPSQWSSQINGQLDWNLGQIDDKTSIPFMAAFASNSGRDAIYFTGDSFTIPYLSNESGHVYVGAGGEWKKAVPYIGVNGEWKKAEAHIGVDGAWKKTV